MMTVTRTHARTAARRPAAHAGSFYAGDPRRLARDVEALLAAAMVSPVERLSATPLGLLVPHAGLQYSGGVAATGWGQLSGRDIGSVVIAGTNHFAGWFDGVGIWSGGEWETPLGARSIDDGLARQIEALGPPFVPTVDAHLEEHSIEVQIPLVARALPDARIVPLLVSLHRPADCREAGRRLGVLLRDRLDGGERVVLVASSDLAHYPPDDRAREVDRQVLAPVQALDPWELARVEAALRAARIRGLACGLCGLEPVLLTLAAVREMGATRGIVLAHATSADVPEGDPGRVVGYAAVAFVA